MSRQKMLEKRFALYSDVYETKEDLQRDLDRDAVELPPPPPLSSPAATSSTSSVAPNAASVTAGKDSKVPTATAAAASSSSEAPPPPNPPPPVPPPAVVKPTTKAPHQYSSSTRNTRQSDIWGNPIVPDFFVVCSVCGQKVNGPRFTTHLVSAYAHMKAKQKQCSFLDDMAFLTRRITATIIIITQPQNKCMGVPKMGRAGQGMNSQSSRG
jgi:hypothetical protein